MEPIFKTVRRSWWERLFGWPWNPLRATKQVRDWKAEFARPVVRAPNKPQADHVRRPLRVVQRTDRRE